MATYPVPAPKVVEAAETTETAKSSSLRVCELAARASDAWQGQEEWMGSLLMNCFLNIKDDRDGVLTFPELCSLMQPVIKGCISREPARPRPQHGLSQRRRVPSPTHRMPTAHRMPATLTNRMDGWPTGSQSAPPSCSAATTRTVQA